MPFGKYSDKPFQETIFNQDRAGVFLFHYFAVHLSTSVIWIDTIDGVAF